LIRIAFLPPLVQAEQKATNGHDLKANEEPELSAKKKRG
jgi:hypothetical protein